MEMWITSNASTEAFGKIAPHLTTSDPPGLTFKGLGDRKYSARPHLVCFEVGGLTQTQSSVTALPGPDTAHGCLVMLAIDHYD